MRNPARANRGEAPFIGWLAPDNPSLLCCDVDCAGAFLALLYVEGYGLSFGQRPKATTLDAAVVDEYILRTI